MEFVREYVFIALELVRTEPILSGLAVLIIYFFVHTMLLSRRLTRLTRGGDGKTLEGTIRQLDERSKALEAHAKKVETALENLDQRMQTSLRAISLERFDPFGNSGKQSFSAAFLNEHGNGVVLSGIHTQSGVRVYAKEIETFVSERELSEEETRAIARAREELR